MEWQPISTAPKGIRVITYHDYGANVANPAHTHFGESGYVSVQASIGDSELYPSDLLETGSVTHWMPLPPPPKEQK
jgi:hypothetical protein